MPKPIALSTPSLSIERQIHVIRGHKVMLDSDLAKLYGVTTGNLNLAVRRNEARFPKDFMFALTNDETESLLLQTARTKRGRGGRRSPPFAFTELGVAMLSSVLNSERAVQMNMAIMRTFVRIRQMIAANKDLASSPALPFFASASLLRGSLAGGASAAMKIFPSASRIPRALQNFQLRRPLNPPARARQKRG